MNKVQDEIINSISIMIDKALENNKQTETKSGVVESISDGKYQVSINGSTYSVYDSVGCNPQVGNKVFVQIPNGKIEDAFITGINKNAKGGGSDVIPNPQEVATDDLMTVKISGTVYDIGGLGNQRLVSVSTLPYTRDPATAYLVRGDFAII